MEWDPNFLPSGWRSKYTVADHNEALRANTDTARRATALSKIPDDPHRWGSKEILESIVEDHSRIRSAIHARLLRLPNMHSQELTAYRRQYPKFHPHLRRSAGKL